MKKNSRQSASGGPDAERHKARATVERLLKIRPRSEGELIERLYGKGISHAVTAAVIDEYKRYGEIDDAAFTRAWVQSRLGRPMGAARIRQELRQKGIDRDLAEQELARASEHYDETETVAALVRRLRQSKYKHLDTTTARRRMYGYLQRRGFSGAAIHGALKEIDGEDRTLE